VIEYSSLSESSISIGDNFVTFCSCATSSLIGLHKMVIIHLSSDEDVDVWGIHFLLKCVDSYVATLVSYFF